MTKQKIGVVGSGSVAQTLASGLAKKGHETRIGSRDPKKLAEYAAKSGVAAGTFEEVAAFGDVVVLSVKGKIAEELVRSLGARLDGKIVIDTTNPIEDGPPVDGSIVPYFTGPNESLMERLQKAAPGARFVKAWNSVGAHLMIDPKFEGGPATMFVCGNDEAAKKDVAAILESVGWLAEDIGKASGARAIEPLCQLWCAPGFLRKDWAHAYRVVRPVKG
jgi:8-hydroxy-5-deazaflavin:NADPH oxidoreductase